MFSPVKEAKGPGGWVLETVELGQCGLSPVLHILTGVPCRSWIASLSFMGVSS